MATTTASRKRAATRRPHHRYKPIKMGKRRWILRGSAAGAAVAVGLVGWALIARRLAPLENTSRDHFDAILVLGTPADDDGNPTPEQLARVNAAVRDYDRGVAPRLIFTGGAAHNKHVEADVMAGVAAAQGIPPSAIFVETKATNTIQNACYTERLMKEHGWRSAEIVTSGYHLPRASMIFGRTSLEWRLRAADSLPGADSGGSSTSALELLKTVQYLVWADWAESCEG
ncbi:MAG TPA: YdcF family protein [Terracidiphilus sp.]